MTAALRLVEHTLSASGFRTARDIMRLNHTIGEITGSWTEYGEWVYFVSVFGEPSEHEPWGWQIDGHHLIVNCFVLGDQVVITPLFMGSEPVVAETGIYHGTSVLQTEQNEGLAFIHALSAEQRGKAILYDSILSTVLPPERGIGSDGRVQTAAFRDNMQIPYEGIRVAELQRGTARAAAATGRAVHRQAARRATPSCGWTRSASTSTTPTSCGWAAPARTTSSTTASTAR